MEPISLAVGTLALLASLGVSSIHRVPEGHVAVYYRGGALMKRIDGPGFRYALPIITQAEYVQTTVQTDNVMKIPCGTQGGTMIEFERIEVVNRLDASMVYDTVKAYTTSYDKTWIYDKIHHEINQICSRSTLEEMYITKFDTLDETLRDALQRDIDLYAPGIRILAIRVTKPIIPEAIRSNYEAIESERTKLAVAMQTQKLVEKKAETERKIALIEAEKEAAVEEVMLQRKLKQKQNEQELELIHNEMVLTKSKAAAEAKFHTWAKEAEANKLLLTPEFLQLEAVRALANNTKVFWGEKLPAVYADGVGLGMAPQARE